MQMLNFTIWVRQKTFTFLYDKFSQDNIYQILSQLVRFCRLYVKNILVCFSSVHSVGVLVDLGLTGMWAYRVK